MAGPWEKYAAQPADSGPWTKYAQQQPQAPAAGTAADQYAQKGFQPKATFHDGQILQNPQTGAMAFVSPGFVTEDKTTIENMLKNVSPAETAQTQMDNQAIAQHPIASRAAKVVQGVPFVGQYADEAIGAIYGDKAKQGTRAAQDAMDRQHPVQSTALQIAGGIAGAVPMAIAAAPAVVAAAPATATGQVLAGMTAAGATGAVEGVISGIGAGNDGNRVQSGMKGGAFGAIAGLVAGVLGPIAARAGKSAVEYLKTTDIAGIAKALGVSNKAAAVLKGGLSSMDPAAAERSLAAAGPDSMLADAGLGARQALDSAITESPKAAQIGVAAVSARSAAAGKRLDAVMNATLGQPQGIKSVARTIAQRTSAVRKRAYDDAYATAIDYAAPTGRKIEEVLGRIPDGILGSAIAEANDAMKFKGAKNLQIMAQIAKDGSVTFREMPNVQQLDEIKKALGTVAKESVDIHGIPTAAGIRASELRKELSSAIGDAVPTYGRAVKLGGDKIAEDNALKIGRKLFSPATSREDVRTAMDGASIEAKDAARQGIREYLDDTLARVRRYIDDPSIDTKETRKLLNDLSSRDSREKLTIVLGKAKADRLFKEIDAAGKHLGTQDAIAKGSDTARRAAQARATDAALAPGIIGNLASGEVVLSGKSITQALTRETKNAVEGRRQEILAEVARALTNIRGPQAQKALKDVQRALEGQLLKSTEAAQIGRILGTGGALLGYQSGKQSLENRLGAK